MKLRAELKGPHCVFVNMGHLMIWVSGAIITLPFVKWCFTVSFVPGSTTDCCEIQKSNRTKPLWSCRSIKAICFQILLVRSESWGLGPGWCSLQNECNMQTRIKWHYLSRKCVLVLTTDYIFKTWVEVVWLYVIIKTKLFI